MTPEPLRPLHQQFLIEDIMPEHEVHLLAGPSGAGKTTLAEQLIIKPYLAGETIWDKRTFPRGVAYVSCDRSKDSLLRSLDRHGISHDAFPYYIGTPSTGGIAELYDVMAWCHEKAPSSHLLVIDGFASLVPGGKISEYAVVAKFLHDCQVLCLKWDLTVLGMPHATKVKDSERIPNPRQRILGSVAWGGFSDLVMILDEEDPEDKDNRNRILHVLPRDSDRFVVRYAMDSAGRLLSLDDQAQEDYNSFLDVELGKLEFDRAYSGQDLVNMAAGVRISRATLYRWLSTAQDAGKLQKLGHGAYQRVRVA